MNFGISYGKTSEAYNRYRDLITSIIEKHHAKRVCDVGGGARPFLTEDFICRAGIEYSVLDISEAELKKAPPNCVKIVADIASPEFPQNIAKFDLVFSLMLAEHVKDGEQFHKNVFKILADDGFAIHFFPTLYTLPFLVNRMFPEEILKFFLGLVAPRDAGKFPAVYSWCRGPVRGQLRKLERIGYDIVEYKGLYGHPYYDKIPLLRSLHRLKTNYLLKRPNPFFTNFACVVLRKSGSG